MKIFEEYVYNIDDWTLNDYFDALIDNDYGYPNIEDLLQYVDVNYFLSEYKENSSIKDYDRSNAELIELFNKYKNESNNR